MLHRRFAAAALVALGLAACQPAAGPLAEADQAKIRANVDAYVKTTLAADWDGWGALLTDDAIMLQPNGPALVGKAASIEFVKAYPKITAFVAPVEEIVGSGDVAWARGSYTLTAMPPGGQPANDNGHWLTTFRKTADGNWLESRIIWHSDVPLPTPAPTSRRGR